jgi:signal transduction histidine kinase
LHIPIERAWLDGIDTKQWVFCSEAASRILKNVASKSRVLLAGSFGALILLIAAMGLASLVVFERLRERESALRTRFAERIALLDQIRSGVYQSGGLARDYLSVHANPDGPKIMAQLATLETETKQAAVRYTDSANAAKLRAELSVYWKTLNLMADVGTYRPRSYALDAYFSRQLAQRREATTRVTGEIEAALIDERRVVESAQAGLFRRFQLILGLNVGFVVVLAAVLSAAALRRLVRLETETRALAAQVLRVQEEERRSIARELHDEVGQALSRLLLDVGNLSGPPAPDEFQTRLTGMRKQAEQTLESVRRIALALRPSMLDDLGLVAALEWQAREIGTRTGLHVMVEAEESAGELPDAHRTCIYRIAQEALENCARHSGANRVTIGLQRLPRSVSLEVRDDGAGFQTARSRGLGLLGMAERVQQFGGRLHIDSEPGHGTRVTAELPV